MAFQIGGNVLDFLVLAVLNHGDEYGYSLTQHAQRFLGVSESAMYPALKRLQKSGYLSTYDQPFQGRNRRYYQITQSGREILSGYVEEWERYKTQMDLILKGEGLNYDR